MTVCLSQLWRTVALGLVFSATNSTAGASTYQVEYLVTIDQKSKYADVSLRVSQAEGQLKRVSLAEALPNFRRFRSEQPLTTEGDRRVWRLGPDGGELSWQAALNRERADGRVDALRRDDWLVMRMEDLFPPMATVTRPGAAAKTRLRFVLPEGWSIVTAYEQSDGAYLVEDQYRRFDQPDGWLVAGDVGVRYDRIANTTVAVAAPKGQAARRLDVMAFLNWHLPQVRDLFPEFPDRLVVAMAGDPFFRGGLSAPNSLFLHTDRPMISGNGTSTLLHELVHVGLNRPAAAGDDWIVEGLAEYYSSELLYRAGTVTRRRYRNTRKMLQEWGAKADALNSSSANGAVTARATTVFAALDAELARRTDGAYRLDDLVSELARNRGELTLSELRRLAERAAGAPVDALQADALPGYAR